MKQIIIVVIRELQSTFDSLMAYIMIVAFLGFSGFFTWLYGSDVFFSGQASLQSFFAIAYWTLFFFYSCADNETCGRREENRNNRNAADQTCY